MSGLAKSDFGRAVIGFLGFTVSGGIFVMASGYSNIQGVMLIFVALSLFLMILSIFKLFFASR